jgi:hypothetical protein
MPTPITEITKAFTYTIANELYSNSTSDNRTAAASYTGPDRTWFFVDETSGALSRVSPMLYSTDDGDSVPTPVGHRKVELVANDDPIVMAMMHEDKVTYTDTTQTTESLPDGTDYLYNNKATLSETYSIDNLVHDGTSWTLGALVPADVTWDDVVNARNGMLVASDGKISPDQPDAVKNPWIAYRTALRNLPVLFKRGEADQIDAWKVQMPTDPESGDE